MILKTAIPAGLVPLFFMITQESPPETIEQPEYIGRAFVFQADLDRGRALGWMAPETKDEEALAAIAASLEERIKRNAGKFVEAKVAREPEGRFSVTFVGPMQKSYEDFLVDGLSRAGRVRLAVPAQDADLGDTTIAAERERLDRWLAADSERDIVSFALVTRGEGGPDSRIRWVPRRAATGSEDEDPPKASAVAVLEARSLLLRRSDLEEAQLRQIEGRWVMRLLPKPETIVRLEELLGGQQEREFIHVLDGEAVDRMTLSPPFDKLVFNAGLSPEEVRASVLAMAGEPFPAPLTFTGFEKRPLQDVRFHVPGDDD